jgi:hypothetical protein
MLGWLAEMVGATISGVLVIYLIARILDRNSGGFDSANARAFKGVLAGFIAISLIAVWGASPNRVGMIAAAPLRLPAAIIVFALLLWKYRKEERDAQDVDDFG